ncbi:hypothetical protein FA15DRAFT_467127 [Coprinopsis marcescibilis]|uniref:CHAT domain-containing protein n=1 Tax=Coprinopsis marcescibilis TaxID=230819 RepID=A0A5C3KSE3_COPMA|nr:hypothetical protein FA15DRAFT_467127 [Coprinopsis marcescibilis]
MEGDEMCYAHLDMTHETNFQPRVPSGGDRIEEMENGDNELNLSLRWAVCGLTVEYSGKRDEELLDEMGQDITEIKRDTGQTLLSHALYPALMHGMGCRSLKNFETTGAESDIKQAIRALKEALSLTPVGDADLPGRLSNLGVSLLCCFHLTDHLSDIDNAITCLDRAIKLTRPGDTELPDILDTLGTSFHSRFERTGNLCDIDKAIISKKSAIDLTSPGHTDLPQRLSSVGSSFERRFKRTGNLSDIGEAIACQERAIQLTPLGNADLPGRLSNLGNSFLCRFQRTGDPLDSNKETALQERAVELIPLGHVDLPACLNNLGKSLLCRFKRTGDLSDINKSITSLERATKLAPLDHADLPGLLNNLGSVLTSRFIRTGKLSDINGAITSLERAVKLMPPGHADLPRLLSNLGSSFRYRFERTGDLSDIFKAIAFQQRLVKLALPGHSGLPGYLSNLGCSLRCRFERTGDLSDIDAAVASQERAVTLTPTGDADLPSFLRNLATSFMCRWKQTGNLSDLSQGVAFHERTVKLTPPGHDDLPGCLSNLGLSFQWRFQQTGNLSDIEEAITALERSIKLTPPGHANLSSYLYNLGNSFISRFIQTGKLSDIGEAITSHKRAVKLTPTGHANPPAHFSSLGLSFRLRFDKTQSPDDLNEALACFKCAATSPVGPPSVKLTAAEYWATLSHQHFTDAPETLLAFETAVKLVPAVAGLEQTVQHRYSTLHNISTFSLSAAAAACSLNRPDKAVEWLEQGRCLVWNQLNNLRTPLDSLRVHDSALAQRVSYISKSLEIAGSRTTSQSRVVAPTSTLGNVSLEEEAFSHIQLANEWDSVLTTIRTTVPGFENFLLPPPCSSLLQNLPSTGPTIIINVHEDRSDALALMAGLDEPFHIPLPCFSFEKAETLRTDLTELLGSFGLRERGQTQESEIGQRLKARRVREGPPRQSLFVILATLWEDVVKPILDALGFPCLKLTRKRLEGEDDEERPQKRRICERSNGRNVLDVPRDDVGNGVPERAAPVSQPLLELPRIWWCATGPLAFLPLHAAGIYDDKDSDTIFNYAVSSYTPTVTSLTNRVKNTRTSLDDSSGLLMVSQPHTPGLSPIPATMEEVRIIQSQLTSRGVQELMLESSAATIEVGLKEMENYNNVHFACHAIQAKDDPLHSGFHFHDGRLSLSTIVKKNLKNANLAFLSACQTSAGDEKLSEEAVHLAAGMLAAGYRGVVGTMWSISDKQAPEVAKDFYEHLLAGERAGIDASRASYALHHAIQKLRRRSDNSEYSLLTWVPYVHFGV